MRTMPTAAAALVLLVASALPAAGFVTPISTRYPAVNQSPLPSSRRSSVTRAAIQTTDAYLNSLSPSVGETWTHPGFATDAYLSSLSELADISSAESSSSPEEYLSSVSSAIESAGSFHLASDISDAANRGLPGRVLDAVPGTTASVEVLSSDINISAGSSSPAAAGEIPPGLVDQAASESLKSESVQSALSSQLPDLSYGSLLEQKATSSLSPDLSSQLSKLSYDSVLEGKMSTNNPIPREQISEVAAATSASFGAAAAGLSDRFSSAKDASAARMSKLFGQAGESMQAGKEKVSSSVEQLGASLLDAPKALQAGTSKAVEAGTASVQGVGGSLDEERSKLVEGSARAVKEFGDRSISDLADSVVGGLKMVGGVLMQILEAFLDKFAGTTVSDLIASAQASVNLLVDGAVATVSGIGEITLAEAARALVALVVTVVKVLFAILSAVVKVASGKGIDDWALVASGEAGKLMAQAGATATDLTHELTHKSINELGSIVGHFAQDVGKLMVESVSVVGDTVAIGSQIN